MAFQLMQPKGNQPAFSVTSPSPEEVLPLQSTGQPRQHIDAGVHERTQMCSKDT